MPSLPTRPHGLFSALPQRQCTPDLPAVKLIGGFGTLSVPKERATPVRADALPRSLVFACVCDFGPRRLQPPPFRPLGDGDFNHTVHQKRGAVKSIGDFFRCQPRGVGKCPAWVQALTLPLRPIYGPLPDAGGCVKAVDKGFISDRRRAILGRATRRHAGPGNRPRRRTRRPKGPLGIAH